VAFSGFSKSIEDRSDFCPLRPICGLPEKTLYGLSQFGTGASRQI